jgi:Trypsin
MITPLRSALAIGVALAVSGLGTTPATAKTGSSPNSAIGKNLSVSHQQVPKVRAFWTRARMRRAEPLDIHRRDRRKERFRAGAPKSGPSMEVPPRPPAGATTSLPRNLRSHVGFSSFPAGHPTSYPYSTSGKVFMRTRTEWWECSATVVNSENLSVVFTAGHCVYSGGARGHWYTGNWTFVPAYHGGIRPYGTFVARQLWTTDGWFGHRNFNYDIGAAILYRNAAGKRVADAVGARGFATGQSRNQNFQAFGYPAEPPFDGKHLWECDSPYGGADPYSRFYPGPSTMSIGCDMNAGSSGGGWIVQSKYLNSVNSYGYDDPTDMYGPYFGQAVSSLFNKVRSR